MTSRSLLLFSAQSVTMAKNTYTLLFTATALVMVMLSFAGSNQQTFPPAVHEEFEMMDDVNETLPDMPDDIVTFDCPKEWSCQGFDYSTMAIQRRGHFSLRSCACDQHCHLLQDCCPDATGRRLLNAARYSRYSLEKASFSCVYDKGVNEANNVSLVTRCPDHYDDAEVTRLCHNVTDDDTMTRLPVSGKVSKVVYRNMYCALCHEEPYLFWAVRMHCTSSHKLPYDANRTTITDMLNSQQQQQQQEEEEGEEEDMVALSALPQSPGQRPSTTAKPRFRAVGQSMAEAGRCQLQFQPPGKDHRWRPCLSDVRDHCSHNFPRDTPRQRYIVNRCEEDETQRLVYGDMTTYRNQLCAICNHNDNTTCQQLVTATIDSSESGVRRPLGHYSFSILLDINTNRGSTTVVGRNAIEQTVERNESISCDQGQVYDPFRSACRPVTCGPGRHFVANACQKKDTFQGTPDPISPTRTTEDTDGRATAGNFMEATDGECSFIQLNDSEYRLLPNSSLELLGTGTLYNRSHYVLVDSQLQLCVHYTRNYTQTVNTSSVTLAFAFSLTEAVVSTCGLCVSLVALAITAFVYLSLRPLRNVPGRNLLSLVGALFLADLLLLVSPTAAEEYLACAVIAGIMHYFFLASFLWMNVMAVDVWFTFSKAFVRAGDRGKSSKRFLMYSAYAWLTPLVFVLSAATVQILKPVSSLSPRYGQGICWLANKYALLLFFAAPLFLLLAVNIVLFIISARNISRVKRSAARMLGKEEEGRLGIYIKLTVVMGITWVLGFVAALVPGNMVLIYCFVLMNTLQGLFIFLSFVLTRKVLSLLKDRFCSRTKFRISKSASTDLTNMSSKSPGANRKLSTASHKSHNVVL